MINFSWSVLDGVAMFRDKDWRSIVFSLFGIALIVTAVLSFTFNYPEHMWPRLLTASVIPFLITYIMRVIFIVNNNTLEKIYEWIDKRTYDSKGIRHKGTCYLSFWELRNAFPRISIFILKEYWKDLENMGKIYSDNEGISSHIIRKD